MKINSLNIVSFGKLKNLKIDFSDNLNIVYGDNEAGKTHIAEFIKVMFYGSGSRARGENNLRKRYKPWDGSKMGGSVDFTHSGKRYRLEREFKASSATDSVTLWDLDLGTSKTLSGSDNIGEQFFGISLGAFQQSVFIDNSVVFSDKGDGGELNMRLANLMNSADEDVSFDKVLKNLTATRDKISPKRTKNAPLPEAEQQLFELTEKKRESESLYREALESQRELELLSQKATALQAEKTELFERLKQLEVYSQKKNLTEFFTALKELEDAEKALKTESGRLTAKEVSALEKELHSLKTNSEIFSRLQAENLSATEEIASLKATPKSDDLLCSLNAKAAELTSSVTAAEAALTEATNDAAVLAAKKTSLNGKPLYILVAVGAAAVLAGTACGVLVSPVLFGVAVLGLLLAVLGAVLKKKPNSVELEGKIKAAETKKADCSERLSSLRAELTKINAEINNMIIKAGTEAELIKTREQQALKKSTELITLSGELEKQKSELFNKIGEFSRVYDIPSAEAAIAEAERLLREYSESKLRAEMSFQKTGMQSVEAARERLAALPENVPEADTEKSDIEAAFRAASDAHSSLKTQIAALGSALKAKTSGVKTPAEYEREIAATEQRISNMRGFIESTDLALAALEEAYALQRRSWGAVLENKVLDIFAGLTSGKYTELTVSKDFEIGVKAGGDISSHAAEYLSRGTLQQAYFSLRLALSEFLCEECGSLPVILDDVFSQYDATRTEKGFEFLGKYSKEHQVILFTCHTEQLKDTANVIEL